LRSVEQLGLLTNLQRFMFVGGRGHCLTTYNLYWFECVLVRSCCSTGWAC